MRDEVLKVYLMYQNAIAERDELLADAKLMADALSGLMDISKTCDCPICSVAAKYVEVCK